MHIFGIFPYSVNDHAGYNPIFVIFNYFCKQPVVLKGYNGELTSMSTTSSLDSGYGCLRSKPRWL